MLRNRVMPKTIGWKVIAECRPLGFGPTARRGGRDEKGEGCVSIRFCGLGVSEAWVRSHMREDLLLVILGS
jgi:hypothetical protein